MDFEWLFFIFDKVIILFNKKNTRLEIRKCGF